MAFNQVAKLALRGSICTKTMRNLPEQEKEELGDIIEEIAADPILAPCKTEFCNALARTIHNEYEDRSVGEQDYKIAIMRAVLAAKYGWGEKKPTPIALTNKIHRKKWFQTWVFNYLRQLLRENKLPIVKDIKHIELPADEAIGYEIRQAMQGSINDIHDHHYKRYLRSILDQTETIETENGFKIAIILWSFPTTLEDRIIKLINIYRTHNIEVVMDDTGISITRKGEVPVVSVSKTNQTQLRSKSFDANNKNDDTNQKDWLESAVICPKKEKTKVEDSETLNKLRKQIPTDILPILDIFMEEHRPDDYVEKYGEGSPKIAHVAEFLGKSPREVKRSVETIRHHCLALGVGR